MIILNAVDTRVPTIFGNEYLDIRMEIYNDSINPICIAKESVI